MGSTFNSELAEQLRGKLNLLTASMSKDAKAQFNVYKQRALKIVNDDNLSVEEKQVELRKIQDDANKDT